MRNFIEKKGCVNTHQGEYEFRHLEMGDESVTVWWPSYVCYGSYLYGGNCNCYNHDPVTWERQTLPREDFNFLPSEWEEVGEDRFCPPRTLQDREAEEWEAFQAEHALSFQDFERFISLYGDMMPEWYPVANYLVTRDLFMILKGGWIPKGSLIGFTFVHQDVDEWGFPEGEEFSCQITEEILGELEAEL